MAALFAAVFVERQGKYSPKATILFYRHWLKLLAQTGHVYFRDRFHSAKRLEYSFCHFTIYLHHGQRRTLRKMMVAARAAQGKVRNINIVLAEDRAHAADHTGNVLIADRQHPTFEWSFNVDAVQAQ